jgi:acetylornithine deacetylase/succinyl-diaminopimelate desuccinylase-like protein
MTQVIAYINSHSKRFIEELTDLLRIPSISTLPEHLPDINKATQFLQEKLVAAGANKVQIIKTTGNPLVYAEKIINPSLPTVLVYGHYDVQPADPYELWHSDPFEPIIKENKIFARGAADDKGQIYMHIKALETMVTLQHIPCNLKFILEGEEETGSNGITVFLEDPAHRDMLKADAILISDTTLMSMDQPSLTTSVRGIVYFEVTLVGPHMDLHSGMYGGAVANPINILCKMLASLHDENRRITIPGFYDKVHTLSPSERAELNQAPFNLADYQQSLGVEAVMGEEGYTTVERTGIRPSLDIHGIWGGYTGVGAKTILPAQAHAKLSMRLVPHQDAMQVSAAFTDYFKSLAPKGTRLTIKAYPGGCNAVSLSQDSMAFQAAKAAFETTWGKQPLTTREGGSIPIIAQFKEKLDCDIVLMGFGLSSDAIHSPNEHFSLVAFEKGIGTIISFYTHFSKLFVGR